MHDGFETREPLPTSFYDAAVSPEDRFLVDLARVFNGHGVECSDAELSDGATLGLRAAGERLSLRLSRVRSAGGGARPPRRQSER